MAPHPHKNSIDCLFIHTPRENPRLGIDIMFMPMGIFALADYIHRRGYSTKILHLGVEKILNSNFSIQDYIKNKRINIIAMPLYWHYQGKDCIGLANRIKSVSPRVKILLGGYTASFFADELIKNHKCIDFIIKGEAEIPLLSLMQEIKKERPRFSAVPNLSWRTHNNEVMQDEHNYVASRLELDALNFSSLNLMYNASAYLRLPSRMPFYSRKLLKSHKTFFLCTGRGCPVNCSFCGGSR